MIWDESLMTLGNTTRRRLCADGTPPTASVESIGAGVGANTKVANAPRAPGLRATGVPRESTRRYHCSDGPKAPLPNAMLASVSAAMRMPYDTVPESVGI